MALTFRQQRFVDLYDGNATQAAIMAGYSKKTARMMGHENLTKLYIAEAIAKRNMKQDAPLIMSRKARQEMWSKVANDKDVDINARLRASELLGKSEADFVDRVEHSGALDVSGILNRMALVNDN